MVFLNILDSLGDQLPRDSRSVLVNKDAIVMWGNSPVLRMVILIWIVLLMISKETVKLNALSEVLNCLQTSDVLKEVEVSEDVDASSDKSMPVNAL